MDSGIGFVFNGEFTTSNSTVEQHMLAKSFFCCAE